MTLTDIHNGLANIAQIRKEIFAFITAAAANGGVTDAVALMAAISRDVATSGADPAAILQTIAALNSINNDLAAGEAAFKAAEATAIP